MPDYPLDMDRLISLYEDQFIPEQRDLLVVFTMRFDDDLTFHAQWELARGFVSRRLASERRLAVILAQHQASLAGFATKGHCHALCFSRRLVGSHLRDFTPLARPGTKALLGAEWADWLVQHP